MDLEKTTIGIYNAAKPSVVHITTLKVQRDRWNLNVQQVPEGTGSGFVWDKQGHVVTNFHVVKDVVQNNGAVQVTLSDQSNWRGTVVGYYPDKDIAVLYIGAPAGKLTPIPIGSSSDLQVGQIGFRHRQSIRTRPHADDRRRQRRRPGDPIGDAAADQERDPDGRGDQPRQQRRPAAGQRRPAGRHEHGHIQPVGVVVRHRLRDPGGRDQPGGAADHRAEGQAGPPRPRRPVRPRPDDDPAGPQGRAWC